MMVWEDRRGAIAQRCRAVCSQQIIIKDTTFKNNSKVNYVKKNMCVYTIQRDVHALTWNNEKCSRDVAVQAGARARGLNE